MIPPPLPRSPRRPPGGNATAPDAPFTPAQGSPPSLQREAQNKLRETLFPLVLKLPAGRAGQASMGRGLLWAGPLPRGPGGEEMGAGFQETSEGLGSTCRQHMGEWPISSARLQHILAAPKTPSSWHSCHVPGTA